MLSRKRHKTRVSRTERIGGAYARKLSAKDPRYNKKNKRKGRS